MSTQYPHNKANCALWNVLNGSSGNHIIIESADSADPAIFKASYNGGTNPQEKSFWLRSGSQYVTFRNLIFTEAFRYGLYVEDSATSDIVVENCLAHHCGRTTSNAESGGFFFDSVDDLTVTDCAATHCYAGFGFPECDGTVRSSTLSKKNPPDSALLVVRPQ